MALETHSNDIAPTLRTIAKWILICEPMEENKKLQEQEPTIKASSFQYNNAVKEPQIAAIRGRGEDNTQQLELGEKDTYNALTTVSKDNMVIEQSIINRPHEYFPQVERPEITGAVHTAAQGEYFVKEQTEPKTQQNLPFKVRRLTERELFRLMDMDDTDIDKIQAAGISKTQQAKMAGNSIVVNCLYHIFRKLFVDTQQEEHQYSLF